MWFTSAFAITFDRERRELDRSGVAREHSAVWLFDHSQKAVNKEFAKPVERFAYHDEKSDVRAMKSAMKSAFNTAMKSALNRRSYKGWKELEKSQIRSSKKTERNLKKVA